MVRIDKSIDPSENVVFKKWMDNLSGKVIVHIPDKIKYPKPAIIWSPDDNTVVHINKAIKIDLGQLSDPSRLILEIHTHHDLLFADYATEFEPYYEYMSH